MLQILRPRRSMVKIDEKGCLNPMMRNREKVSIGVGANSGVEVRCDVV